MDKEFFVKKFSKMFGFVFVMLLLLAACGGADSTPTPPAVSEADIEAIKPTETAVAPAATSQPQATVTAAPTMTAAPTATAVPAFQPVFEEARCQFDVPSGRDARCGYLTVPEDHFDVENGRTLRLHVAIFASDSANPAPDPVVYLEGGPGGDALETVPLIFEERFAPFLADRDFIMFDQRGTGYSEPSLACPEYTELAYETLEMDLEPEEEIDLVIDALTQCHRRLLNEDVNFTVYNSAQSAADVDGLRAALGYEQWNLFGISYGTRLAQTIMRDFPAGVRSAVLDSSYPLSADLNTEIAANADRAIAVFFASCAADPGCNETFPNLETVFFDLVDRLNAEPITVQVFNIFEGDRYDALLGGDDLITVLFQSLYAAELIPSLPQLIYEVAEGNTTNLGALLSSFLLNVDFVSVGMQYAVQCSEEAAFSAPGDGAAAAAAYPELAEVFVLNAEIDEQVCAFWGAGTADARENELVISEIPTLILAGEFDPITPPAWADQVAAGLSNATVFEYPAMGHGVSLSDACPREMVLAFWVDPLAAPNAACIADMGGPVFAGVDTGAGMEIVLVPVTIDLGIAQLESVAPENWTDAGFGSYARGSSALDQTAVLQQAVPATMFSSEALLELLASQLQLEGVPESSDEYEDAEERMWTLYETELQGFPVSIGVYDDGAFVYFVMLIATAQEREELVTAVFQPVMDAITVP